MRVAALLPSLTKALPLGMFQQRGAIVVSQNTIKSSKPFYSLKDKPGLLIVDEYQMSNRNRFEAFISNHRKDQEWIVCTHGISRRGDTYLSFGFNYELSSDQLLSKIPKNSIVYLAFCYQLSDEKWQEISVTHPTLTIIAVGDVDKTSKMQKIPYQQLPLDINKILKEYSCPLTSIRIFKNGEKLEQINPLDYLEKSELVINDCNITINPILLGARILLEYPDKISDFFNKFSQHFLPVDMAKINEILSQVKQDPTKQDSCQQLIKQFFTNCILKQTLQTILSTEVLKEDPNSQSKAISILKHFEISDKIEDLTPEKVEQIKCFHGVKTKPLTPQAIVDRVGAVVLQDKQNQLS